MDTWEQYNVLRLIQEVARLKRFFVTQEDYQAPLASYMTKDTLSAINGAGVFEFDGLNGNKVSIQVGYYILFHRKDWTTGISVFLGETLDDVLVSLGVD